AAAGHGAPHALGGGGHVDIGDAERRQSIHHSVHDRGRRADGAGLAAAFGTQRVVRAERGVGLELERKEIVGTRHAIVHERACLELPALVVIKRIIVERLAMPWTKAPWTWPSTISGLMMRPKSSAPVKLTSSTVPVSRSISISAI